MALQSYLLPLTEDGILKSDQNDCLPISRTQKKAGGRLLLILRFYSFVVKKDSIFLIIIRNYLKNEPASHSYAAVEKQVTAQPGISIVEQHPTQKKNTSKSVSHDTQLIRSLRYLDLIVGTGMTFHKKLHHFQRQSLAIQQVGIAEKSPLGDDGVLCQSVVCRLT